MTTPITTTTPSPPASAQLGATLAAVTYRGQESINQLRRIEMNRALAATTDGWQLVWGPVTAGEDLMFVARQGSSDQYALAVRGTLITRIENVVQDLGVDTMVTPSFALDAAFGSAQIAAGAQTVWNNLSTATPGIDLGKGTVLELLQGITGGFSLLVTGHSLGGQTATVLAAWLQHALGSAAQVELVTIAAPTAGDQAFASGIDAIFGQGAVSGYYNALDVVPNLWATLPAILALFPGGPACGSLCKAAVDSKLAALEKAGLTYVQPSTRQSLPGALYSVSGVGTFEKEALDQHSAQYYMFLLGVPLATVQQAGANASWEPPPSS